jgi:hypothetical protein
MGAALLSNQETAVAIIAALVQNLSIPVSAKIRLLPEKKKKTLEKDNKGAVAVATNTSTTADATRTDALTTAPTATVSPAVAVATMAAEAATNTSTIMAAARKTSMTAAKGTFTAAPSDNELSGVDLPATIAFAKRLVNAGACAITIHCRLPADRSEKQAARWSALKPLAVALFPTPVLLNGDAYDPQKMAQLVMAAHPCAGVMLARPALLNASVFACFPSAFAAVSATSAMVDTSTASSSGTTSSSSSSSTCEEGGKEDHAVVAKRAAAAAAAEGPGDGAGGAEVTHGSSSSCSSSSAVDDDEGSVSVPLRDMGDVVRAYILECFKYDARIQNAKYTVMEATNLKKCGGRRDEVFLTMSTLL